MIDFNEKSLDVEQSLLGSLLQLGDTNTELFSKTIRMVKEKSFYSVSHKAIFRAIKLAANRNNHVDMTLVNECLKASGDEERSGGIIYLAEMMRSTPSAANIIGYAKIVREYSVERYANSKLNEMLGMFNDSSTGDVYQRLGMLETTIGDILNLGLKDDKAGLKHISESLGTWLDNIEDVRKDGVDKNKFTTGIESLDDILGVKGLRRGGLYGVGARPKMGKSAFMMLIANHFALDLNEFVAVFSMEMPEEEIAERSITNRTLLNPSEFYRKDPSTESTARLDTTFSELVKSGMHVDDGTGLTLGHIQREARKLRKEKGSIGLICVDYLTLMEAEKADRNDLAYGMITKALKNLAKELNCVVLMLTQLNRGLESRADKRPMPSDSRDTGQIEQDVDGWFGLYMESVYDEEVSFPGLTEVLVRLNRHGGKGTAFVEMRQGFHVPVSNNDGATELNIRKQKKKEEEPQTEFTPKTKKYAR